MDSLQVRPLASQEFSSDTPVEELSVNDVLEVRSPEFDLWAIIWNGE